MNLQKQIEKYRAKIRTDGYPMSIGELASMYKDGELDLHPEFQRFFRWSPEQKSRLVESLLLGIPLPSVFVSQRQDGVWDVIDGLQRLSTIFELMGILKDEDDQLVSALNLTSTKYLPQLAGKRWDASDEDPNALGSDNQKLIKRTKIDLKIILRESDESSKYELFQRLNTGGSFLSDQEIRNCLLVMIDRKRFLWLRELSQDSNFRRTISLSERAIEEQFDMELIVRFIVFRSLPKSRLRSIGELGEFLNEELLDLIGREDFNPKAEEKAFRFTFEVLAQALEDDAFRRYDSSKKRHVGPFLISAFEVLALGLGHQYNVYQSGGQELPDIAKISHGMWKDKDFLDGIGSGVRASSRIPITIEYGRNLFAP